MVTVYKLLLIGAKVHRLLLPARVGSLLCVHYRIWPNQ